MAPGVFNKNLKMFYTPDSGEDADLQIDGGANPDDAFPRGLNSDRRNKHQILITTLYNKAIMLHLSPQTGEIFIHELDPQMTFKYSQSIQIQKGDAVHQMQVADNLIVVHNIEQKSTNFYDIKLAEYAQPVCVDNLDVDT